MQGLLQERRQSFQGQTKEGLVENHALVDLLNGVAHLLCNSTLHDLDDVPIAGHLFRKPEEDATTRKKSSNQELV